MDTKATIAIAKPINQIFEYAAQPHNFPHYISCINNIDKVRPDNVCIGQNFTWKLNVAGVDLEGKGEMTKFDPPRVFEFHFEGDMEVLWKFNFFQTPGDTKVNLAINYNFEENPLHKLGDQHIVSNLCALISKQILENLKVLLESQK